MWIPFNPNPVSGDAGDCTVRALCAALSLPWEAAYDILASAGRELYGMPSENRVWGTVLRRLGFRRHAAPDLCPGCYSVSDFAKEHPSGTFFVCPREHIAAVINGDWLDSWDCGGKNINFYWSKT